VARLRQLAGLIGAAAISLAAASPSMSAERSRIVSLNLCTDQILLDLVPRERIAALSFLASDTSMSPRVREARGLPKVRGEAEEILALEPDLIFAGAYSTPATVSLLERLGQRVVRVPMASSFAQIRDVVRLMADAVGARERGEVMISEFDRRLSAISGDLERERRPRAIAMQVNSLASGSGSLVDEVLTAAGYTNMATEPRILARLGPAGRMPLETLLLNPPDLIVLANAASDFRTVLGDNLRHPAFKRLAAEHTSVHLPMRDWLCGTPHLAKTVELLAATRRELDSAGRSGP
jgi:iron complex transport system substrate-binding protein